MSIFRADKISPSNNITVFQKGCHQTHGGNFVKPQVIFKIDSPLEINRLIIFHNTLNLLPHYLWEFITLLRYDGK